jgi:hypothetical protein
VTDWVARLEKLEQTLAGVRQQLSGRHLLDHLSILSYLKFVQQQLDGTYSTIIYLSIYLSRLKRRKNLPSPTKPMNRRTHALMSRRTFS